MASYKKLMALIVILFTFIIGSAHAEQRPDVADNVIAYKGQQGVIVWTLRIGDRNANEALVQLEGIDHDWNLKIQKMQVEKTSKDTRYSININGNKFVALIIENKCCGNLYIPGEPQPISVNYSEGISHEGNAQAFLTDYLQDKNNEK